MQRLKQWFERLSDPGILREDGKRHYRGDVTRWGIIRMKGCMAAYFLALAATLVLLIAYAMMHALGRW